MEGTAEAAGIGPSAEREVPPALTAEAAVPAEEAAGPAPTRFRIFKRGGWRKAFRLEDVVWETLEQAATGEGLKLADYVRRLTGAFGPDVNVSSQMRVSAVEWLSRRCRMLQQRQAPDRLLAAVLAAPLPCFVISGGRELVRSNAEFQAYLAARAREAGGEAPGAVTMALDAPMARVLALLAGDAGRAVACGFSIRAGTATMTGRARVTLLPDERDWLVGYVLPDAPQP